MRKQCYFGFRFSTNINGLYDRGSVHNGPFTLIDCQSESKTLYVMSLWQSDSFSSHVIEPVQNCLHRDLVSNNNPSQTIGPVCKQVVNHRLKAFLFQISVCHTSGSRIRISWVRRRRRWSSGWVGSTRRPNYSSAASRPPPTCTPMLSYSSR